MKRNSINLEPFTVFKGSPDHNLAGKDYGSEIREKLGLESLEKAGTPCEVLIPDHIDYISTGFFVGLFGPSIAKLNTIDAFNAHYTFVAPDVVTQDIQYGIARIYRM